jgi:CRISPR system Cascade subunit CasE
MMITKARLSRAAGTQGSLAKVLLDGAAGDRNHGLVWSLFSRPDEAKRDFLYREIEPGAFIVVSDRAPEDPRGLWTIEQQEYEPQLAIGDPLRFVLRANPTLAVPQPGEKRGKRVDVIMHAKSKLDRSQRADFSADDARGVALDWLIKRGPAIGAAFDLDHCDATGYIQVKIPRGPNDPDRPSRATGKSVIEFSEIDFEGVLTVTDPEKLCTALFKGIGKAKAFGCGLMMVRRV